MATINEYQSNINQAKQQTQEAKQVLTGAREKMSTPKSILSAKGIEGLRQRGLAMSKITTNEQALSQREQAISQAENALQDYLNTEEGKIQYAQEQGLQGQPVYDRIVKGGVLLQVGTKYETPYGEVTDYSLKQKALRSQARAEFIQSDIEGNIKEQINQVSNPEDRKALLETFNQNIGKISPDKLIVKLNNQLDTSRNDNLKVDTVTVAPSILQAPTSQSLYISKPLSKNDNVNVLTGLSVRSDIRIPSNNNIVSNIIGTSEDFSKGTKEAAPLAVYAREEPTLLKPVEFVKRKFGLEITEPTNQINLKPGQVEGKYIFPQKLASNTLNFITSLSPRNLVNAYTGGGKPVEQQMSETGKSIINAPENIIGGTVYGLANKPGETLADVSFAYGTGKLAQLGLGKLTSPIEVSRTKFPISIETARTIKPQINIATSEGKMIQVTPVKSFSTATLPANYIEYTTQLRKITNRPPVVERINAPSKVNIQQTTLLQDNTALGVSTSRKVGSNVFTKAKQLGYIEEANGFARTKAISQDIYKANIKTREGTIFTKRGPTGSISYSKQINKPNLNLEIEKQGVVKSIPIEGSQEISIGKITAKGTIPNVRSQNVIQRATTINPIETIPDSLSSGKLQLTTKQKQVLSSVEKAAVKPVTTKNILAKPVKVNAVLLSPISAISEIKPVEIVKVTPIASQRQAPITGQSIYAGTGQYEKTTEIVSPLQPTRVTEVSIVKPRERQEQIISPQLSNKNIQIVRMEQPVAERTNLKELNILASNYVSAQASKQKLAQSISLTRPSKLTKTITAIKVPRVIPRKGTSVKSQAIVSDAFLKKAYNVVVGTGKRRAVIGKALPIGRATELGVRSNLQTLRASFKLEEVGTTSAQDINFKAPSSIFTPSKREAGRLVQRSKFRLSSGSEKLEIKQARRRKNLKLL